jgi:putative CocE/NonD family hydrolase
MNARQRIVARLWWLALTFSVVGGQRVLAQPPDPGDCSAAEHEVAELRNQRVPMRDGVHLAVDVFRPEAGGRFPVILCQTPYNKNGLHGRASWFVERGYVVANADVRGRYASDGAWDPFDPKHKTDGYDLVEWLAEQPWSNGKVGTYGLSYMGWTQWWTATQAPPSLKAIIPEVAPPDQFFNCPYQHGVLVGWMMDWASMMAGRTRNVVAKGGYGGFTNTRFEDLMRTPYVDLDDRRKLPEASWFDTWIRENLASAQYWRAISYQGKENFGKIAVPSLAISGWFDANFPGTPMNYLGMKEFGATPEARRPRMVIGPWTHTSRGSRLLGFDYGSSAQIDWNGYMCRFFDHYLKGVDNGLENDPPVHVFVMGRNRWRAADDWPLPQTRWTKYYFRNDGKAEPSRSGGTLGTEPPLDEPPDEYTYDPDRPTRSPFEGPHIEGPVDARKFSSGRGVLIYTTPPLETSVEITGPIVARLFASTSARDTDWMVRLIDVHPNGYAALLTDGVLRARCRDPERGGAFNPRGLCAIEPNEAYEYTIDFWRATANAFLKGHRIRVEVSSSYYPYYLRNLNTGADNIGLETSSVIARQTIYHDRDRPSHIILPVIPIGARP